MNIISPFFTKHFSNSFSGNNNAYSIPSTLLDRFLRYIQIDTQSDPDSTSFPSTAKQKNLSSLLVKELHDLGVSNASMDEYGYVYATIESNSSHPIPASVLLLFKKDSLNQ